MNNISAAQEIYDQLYRSSIHLIRSGEIDIDQHLLDKKSDHRRGLSIILRPDENTSNIIERFQEEMRTIDDGQYYQPKSDLHITVLSIITAFDGFRTKDINLEKHSNIIIKALKNQKKFPISLQGVTCTAGAVMMQGFDIRGSLQLLRENIKHAFNHSKINDSLDSRYPLKTAHSTVARFTEILKNSQSYYEIIEKYRNLYFGSFDVTEVDFVYHDWYQSKESLQIIQKVKLL